MAIPPTIACPHCSTLNPLGGAFCEACGKALPTAVSSGPRVVGDQLMPTTAAGQQLVSDELQKQTKKAAYTLLGIGILQLVCGAIIVTIMSKAKAGAEFNLPILLVAQFGVAAVFIGLFFWARKSPLPASIAGLVVYSTLVILNVVASASQLSEPDRPKTGFGGLGIGWLDIVIMVMLVQGIQAGLKHKRLLEQQGG